MTFGRLVVRSKRTAFFVALAGVAMLLSGCGGHQNPIHDSSVHVPRWVTGLWDGSTVAVGFVAHIVNRSKYDFIAAHFGAPYFIGWLLGVLLFLAVFGGIGYRRLTVLRRRPPAY
jgi:hypothetical protein